MNKISGYFISIELFHNPVVKSILVVFSALMFKFFFSWLMKIRAENKKSDVRNTINNIRHFISIISILFFLLIWAVEIQDFALSIAAFAAAIVLATRDFIQCFAGFVYVITTSLFKIGDWIKLGDSYGEVVATNWMKTTLIEIDIDTYQISRKTLSVPNSSLIHIPIMNMNYIRRFVTHEFIITRKESINPFPIYTKLLDKANSYCEDFLELATRYNSILERKLDSSISGPEPEIYFSTTSSGDFKARFIIFCPTERAIEIERKITSDFMSLWYIEVERKYVPT